MVLTDSEIERYSRQIIVPGLGANGQARLCAARIAVLGNEAGGRIATLYARALGCSIVPADVPADVVIVAGSADLDDGTVAMLAGAGCPIVWYSLAGAQISSGVITPPDVFDPRTLRDARVPATDVVHAIAACDAVSTAAALILGWDDVEAANAVALA